MSAVASVVDLAVAKDATDSALVYFLTADVFVLLCIITSLLLPKLAYSRSVAAKDVVVPRQIHMHQPPVSRHSDLTNVGYYTFPCPVK